MKNIQIHTMVRRKIAAMTLAGAAAAILIAAPYTFVSAEDSMATPYNTTAQQMGKMPPAPQMGMENRIQQYVTNGKITSEQADKLKKALQEQHQKEQKDREKFMKNLPAQTGVSEATLKEIMKPQAGPHRNFKHGGNPGQQMKQLVQNGKVTQDEATALETYFKNHHPQNVSGSPETAQSTHQRQHKTPDEMCQEIATSTGISQSRVKAIMELMRPQGAPPQGEQGQPLPNES
jgi:polyhydroxyalkanoate synthesis regulator phasin